MLDFLTGQYPALFALGFTARVEQLLDEVAAGEVEYAEAVGEIWNLLRKEQGAEGKEPVGAARLDRP